MSKTLLTDPYFINAFEKEKAYLRKFDVNRLAAGFRKTAGIATKYLTYGGWETSLISGHFVGHYLTATAQTYRECGDEDFLDTSRRLVSALAEAQLDNGFLFATAGCVSGEAQFDNVESGKTDIFSQAWVPWYTLHKILAGLVDAYTCTGNSQALKVASRLGDWVHERTTRWSEATHATVLSIEYGGMNDCLYELYKITKDKRHAIAAHAFDETALFEEILHGHDILDGRHANTTIPKFIGALNRYRTFIGIGKKDFEYATDSHDIDFYLESAKRFWDMVVRDHTYITGGNSEDEHFGAAGILDAERTNVNCETCNTYNMLKLTKELFTLTGEKKYADFYENTFINAIMSSQHPETGMTMYFQPMATGYFKAYGSEFEHFWCCTGSGTENFTKLSDFLYFLKDDEVSVNLYISSVLDWNEKGIRITQESSLPDGDTTKCTVTGAAAFRLKLRIPDWIAGPAEIRLNGKDFVPETRGGYTVIDRSWSDGDTVEMRLPMKVISHPLPDNSDVMAFKYGPVVLSAALGSDAMTVTPHGVGVLKPLAKANADECITIAHAYGSKDDWLSNLGENFLQADGKDLALTLRNTDRTLVFTPHYRQYRERYGIYWRIIDARNRHEKKETETVIDSIQIGHDQQEPNHRMESHLSHSGIDGGNYRYAVKGGYFRYIMAVEARKKNRLVVTYSPEDARREFSIYIDDVLLKREKLGDFGGKNLYETVYEIQAVLTNSVAVKFAADRNADTARVYNKLKIVANG